MTKIMKKILIISIIILFFVFSFGLIIRLNGASIKFNQGQNVQQAGNSQVQGSIRSAAASGTFYPKDTNELKKEISQLLKGIPKKNFKGVPRILIVPHAGINYSGSVAAYGFKQIEELKNLRIILLGASHTARFDYVAIDNNDSWETPLGKVEVDNDFVQTLSNGRSIRVDKNVHSKEHSLEMELIFLQSIVSDIKIVPVLLGQTSEELISILAQKLAYNFNENTILVVSSDLSHYPTWEVANTSDNQLIDSILKGKASDFTETLKNINSKNYSGLETAACGKDAIKVALELSEILGINNFEKLSYENSGDVTRDKTRVVGYTSILGYSDKLSFDFPGVDEDYKHEALIIARSTLESYLSTKTTPAITNRSSYLEKPLGVFVTLTKNGQLRGCMGEFEPAQPLYKVIQDAAISSATKDKRFTPVKADELKDIKIEISVMTPRKKVNNWQDIRLGRDGVVIQKEMNTGTFLPQVASDNNWDLEKFLSELCTQKAGLSPDCYKDSSSEIYSFEVQVYGEK